MEYELRDYQQKAVDDAIECFKSKKAGILVLPTGSGKSLIVASLVTQLGGNTIILQPTKEILEQNRDHLRSTGYRRIGVYSASLGRKDIRETTFATIGSVVRKQELFKLFNRIIIDECHKVNAKGGMYEDFITGLGLPIIGLTATPYRMRSYNDFQTGYPVAESRIITRTRPRIFNKICHITQINTLFERGYLCSLDYDWQNGYDSKKVKSNSTGMGFDEPLLREYNRKQCIPDKMIKLISSTKRKHCLGFTKFTSESQEVIAGLQRLGVSCSEISAKTHKKDREHIIADFKQGRIKCVINVGVLTTGFDFPELDCVVLGRPIRSVALYYQIVGRGIRIADGKDSCGLFDLCDNVKRFGKIETFELYDQNDKGMWRLRSDKGNLTGIDAITGRNLEKVSGPETNGQGEKIMPFGKHKGVKLTDLPDGYLKWGAEAFEKPAWKTAFNQELKRREAI